MRPVSMPSLVLRYLAYRIIDTAVFNSKTWRGSAESGVQHLGMGDPPQHRSVELKFFGPRPTTTWFRTIKGDYIKEVLRRTNFNLIAAAESLKTPPNDMIMIAERPLGCDADVLNAANCPAAFIREVELFEHKTEILDYLNSAKLKKPLTVDSAKDHFFPCECCLADDVPLDQIIACRDGHLFCVDCIMNYVHTTVKEGRLEFKCMFFQFCRGSLLTSRLEKIISPAEIERLNAESQVQGIKRAHLPGVEFCPVCNYAAVLEDKDLLFQCQKCRVVTCRRCKIDHGASGHCPLQQQERPSAPERSAAPSPVPVPVVHSFQDVRSPVPLVAYPDRDFHGNDDVDDSPDCLGFDHDPDDGDYPDCLGFDLEPDDGNYPDCLGFDLDPDDGDYPDCLGFDLDPDDGDYPDCLGFDLDPDDGNYPDCLGFDLDPDDGDYPDCLGFDLDPDDGDDFLDHLDCVHPDDDDDLPAYFDGINLDD